MGKNTVYRYFVEGESEQVLISTLKTELGLIVPGKVEILNIVQNIIGTNRLRVLQPGTVAILVYDTDVGTVDILKKNIAALKKCAAVK